jgi:Tol biopolymer transport system component
MAKTEDLRVQRATFRAAMLIGLVAVAALAVSVARQRAGAAAPPHLAWVAEAHQLGPVGYRDPAGAISPDGLSIAYSEGRFLRVRPTSGGPSVDLPAGDAQIRSLFWRPDGRSIVTDADRSAGGWIVYDVVTRTRARLWVTHDPIAATVAGSNTKATAAVADLRQLAWSPEGRFAAAVVNARDGPQLWTIAADGSTASAKALDTSARVSFPTWTPGGEIACISTQAGKPRVTIPCGGRAVATEPPLDIYGPIAFAPDRPMIYGSAPNASGTLDLWTFPVAGGRATQITYFSRDTYAPTIARDGRVLFKVQSYRTVVAVADAAGGATRPLATFQSETPSWDPTGRWLGITYGSWRRVIDDANYPDIAQDAGVIEVLDRPLEHVNRVAHASPSEDQSLCWSPNGRWMAFHSHKDQSDDIWLRPADRDSAEPRRISFLGRGSEVGWPRWSPDGRWILFSGSRRDTRRPALFVVGVDQDSGRVTADPKPIAIPDFAADVGHAEWLPDNAHVVAIAKEAAGRQAIAIVSIAGAATRVVHRFSSEHDSPGLAASPDGRDVAFIAPAPDGYFQVFRMPLSGGAALQVTADPSNKTQPAWSPDGTRIAFTVWSYDAQFWRVE